jgi:hypothetical protein
MILVRVGLYCVRKDNDGNCGAVIDKEMYIFLLQ